ncbi:THO complex subunit 2 [Dionaea muscipula]
MSLPRIDRNYLTDDSLRELKNGNPNFKFPNNPVPMLRFLYELCWSMVHGELPIQKCKVALEAVEYLDDVPAEELGSNLADIVTQMALDMTMTGESRARLIKLARWLVESTLVPLKLFQERCEEEFLWESEMVKIKAQDLKSKEVRVNTRLLYQQTKFNLLREESEGYAKLVTLLCQDSEASSAKSSTVGIIKSLIGHFDLDPNRVFDILLECFELQPQNNLFLDLIPIFPKFHASQVLGFKFQYYQRLDVHSPVPFGLYKLAALLIKEDFIDLDSIYAHLLPNDEDAFEHHSAFSTKRLEEANKIGKINLAATGKDLMDDEKQGDVTIDLFAALDIETEGVTERSSELENNQKLGLLVGFLSVDDWYHANLLFERLSPLNPVAHIKICIGLFRLIEKSLSSAFTIVRQRHMQNDVSMESTDIIPMEEALIDLPKELFEMLSCAGPYLYRDTLLLQKICKVLRGYYLSALKPVGNNKSRLQLKEARSRIEEALGSCILPSLQLIPANPAVGHGIWEVMCLLPYETRYRLYGEWEKDDERSPMILAARQTAKLDTRRILKRLAKENLKQLGRMVAKLAHANPVTVLRTIVCQIEAYRDMITPVVDAFKYLTQLEYDVLEYVVIERLAQAGRDKLKEDGINLSDWLQSLASFWGHLCKKYPSMELRGLFQYLVNQLKRGQGIELILLQELIQQMANVQYTENMTEEHLDAMAGGETLRYQATSFGIMRNNKALIKSTNRLKDSLLPKEGLKLAIPLLVLISQHRSLVVINADVPYIKMASEQYDRCHGILLQYVEFLCSAFTPATTYAQLVPPLNDLIHSYHLEPEVAFLIFRPVMRLFKRQGSSNIFWPLYNSEVDNSSSMEIISVDPDDLILDLGSSHKPIRWSDLVNTVRTMLPSKAWNSLSPGLYATFWGLMLYDLYVPRNRYESEIAKQHAALKALEELPDNSSSAIAKRKKDKERIQESLDRLTGELQKHEGHVSSVRRRLSQEKDKWWSSCPDTLKINMEFLQRCIFPRCTFSIPDAVYCAMFVHALHSLGTPFFNTVNHIDVLICKTLHPMICSCTEYEAGRLGRFLFETLKIAYYWKSDESIYEHECGNMPGFAVYYRFPNSQRVTFAQFIKVHWKWNQRITRLLIQCLESTEYMEIRNALIMLTKISSVFPVTRKSGINIEKRVTKIKGDDREDLKVLATSVGAALAARKPSWVSEEEFGMGYLELKPTSSLASKSLTGNGLNFTVSFGEPAGGRTIATGTQQLDLGNSVKDQTVRSKPADGKYEKTESVSGNVKTKAGSVVNGSQLQSSMPSTGLLVGTSRSVENQNETTSRSVDENMGKIAPKISTESESKAGVKRSLPGGSLTRPSKGELVKDESRSVKTVAKISGSSGGERDHATHPESRQAGSSNVTAAVLSNGSEMRTDSGAPKSSDLRGASRDDGIELSEVAPPSARSVHSPRHDAFVKSTDKQQKRTSPAEESEKGNKRRKADSDVRNVELDTRFADRDRVVDTRLMDKSYPMDPDKSGLDEQSAGRNADRHLDRIKDKSSEKFDRDHRERSDRGDKPRDDILTEKSRDRSMERYAREHSVERMPERGTDRSFDRPADKAKDERNKDERGKLRLNEMAVEKSHIDDRFFSQNLPPPPPLPPHMVPLSVNSSRRDEDVERKFAAGRHSQRLSPRHDEKERRRSEENLLVAADEAKRRREDDIRDKKRDDRDVLPSKVEERDRERDRERERDRLNLLKEEIDANAASKRRKLKREHLPGGEPGEYSPGGPPPPPHTIGMSQPYDGRDRGERKGSVVQRPGLFDDQSLRVPGKEPPSKMTRRDIDPMYDREWNEEKRQRVEPPKRRHRK